VKIDAKGLAIIILVLCLAVLLAYQFGVNQSQRGSTEPTTASVPATSPDVNPGTPGAAATMPAGHPVTPDPNGPSFTHFRVGNRNVKGMVAVKDAVWVGTSGGAIRYDLKSENYEHYDVNNGSLLSNGVFSNANPILLS